MNERSKLTGATHALRLPGRAAALETYCGYPIEILPWADMITSHHGEITCAECARVSAERPAEDEGSVHVVYIPASGQGGVGYEAVCGSRVQDGRDRYVTVYAMSDTRTAVKATCRRCLLPFGLLARSPSAHMGAAMRYELRAIVAYDRNRLIGAKGALPWRYPEDLAHFRRETLGRWLIMGRKTYESIGSAPFPGRPCIVLSRSAEPIVRGDGVMYSPSLIDSIYAVRNYPGWGAPYVIGGAEIYRAAMPYLTEIIATEIDEEYEGDTYFPELGDKFVEVSRRSLGDSGRLEVATYRRRASDDR